jgi:hypothetical protein
VHDEDDLYRLVLSVLERLAVRLPDISQLLWNETRPVDGDGTVWRPKYEPDISAFLKYHLEQALADRLVVNREVLVQHTTSKGHGLSVDVLASGGTSVTGSGRLPQCPIEVKGSWNRGLFADLQAQLVDDYMHHLGATRGIYVCGWFPPAEWDDDADGRRATAASRTREDVQRRLDAAAEDASSSGRSLVSAVVLDVPRPSKSARKDARG